jgi:hypothetical protein
MGLWITKLWTYPSYSLANYFVLYLLIYPFGGFVMLYSFALLESIFIPRPRKNRLKYKQSLLISKTIAVIGLIGLIISITIKTNQGFWIYSFMSLLGIGVVSYNVLKIKKNNLLERSLLKSLKYILLILIVAYTQGIFHEFPNVFARELAYQNFPFENITLLGIPVIVLFLGWIALVIAPYIVFEWVISINKVDDLIKHE